MEKKTAAKAGAIIYVRVSSEEQVKGTSLDDQQERCTKYCAEQGMDVIGVYRDEGTSAKTTNRKQLLEAIEFCRTNKGSVSALVVWKVDRFARNTADHFMVRKALSDYGVKLHSVTEPIGNDPGEKLFETMLAGFAEFDNEVRKLRATNGMLARLKHGIWPYKPPPGYICQRVRKQGLKKTEPDKVDPVIFPVLQRLLKAFAREACTQTDIANELRKINFRGITGTKADLNLVDKMLGSHLPFYAGLLRNPWPDDECPEPFFMGGHEAAISVEEMHQIKCIRSGRKPTRILRERSNELYPLRRLVLCAACLKPMTASSPRSRSGSRYAYYHCYNRDCVMRHKAISKADIESKFQMLLEQIIPRQEFLSVFTESIILYWEEQKNTILEGMKAHQNKVRELEARRLRIFEMSESGAYSPDQFKERMGEIEEKLVEARIALSAADLETYDIKDGTARAKQAMEDNIKNFLSLPLPVRARFQKLIFPDGIPYHRDTGFGTPILGRIFELNRTFVSTNSLQVRRVGFEPT